jgi:polar amino acid transport system substrate-binding protein
VLSSGKADVYGENLQIAYGIAAELPGATVLEGRFNVVLMSIGVPKSKACALPVVNDFVAGAKRDGLIGQAIARAELRGVRPAP